MNDNIFMANSPIGLLISSAPLALRGHTYMTLASGGSLSCRLF